MRVFRSLVACLVLALTACGTGNSVPPAEPGVLFATSFRDAHPVDFANPKPSRFPVHGIDAARFQKSIDWNLARANGVNFAFLKATEGGDLLDPKFKDHWRAAHRSGMWRGAYHFYYFCTTPEVQARWFIRNVPRVKGALPPVLDMEWNPFSPTCAKLRPPGAVVRANMRIWLDMVEAHYGQRPIIYTTPKFYAENGLGRFKGYDFWLRTTAKTPREAYPGQSWRFWQYSATGLIPGIQGEVDLNAFSGSQEDWMAWVARRVAQ